MVHTMIKGIRAKENNSRRRQRLKYIKWVALNAECQSMQKRKINKGYTNLQNFVNQSVDVNGKRNFSFKKLILNFK